MRVVSLLPSATEVLCAIGGQHLLVGRSHECDFPAGLEHLPILTGQRTHAATSAEIDAQVSAALGSGQSLYTLDVDRLRALKPDVILTQDLCDVCSIDLATVRGAAATMDPKPAVVSLNPTTLWQVLDDVLAVGEAVGMADQAQATMVRLRANGASPAVELPVSRRQARELRDRLIRDPMRSFRPGGGID